MAAFSAAFADDECYSLVVMRVLAPPSMTILILLVTCSDGVNDYWLPPLHAVGLLFANVAFLQPISSTPLNGSLSNF